MLLILHTVLSCPVHFLRYSDENASETLNKKGYNHYKFSFMLLKSLFRKMCIFQASIFYAKQNQSSEEEHTLTLRYNHSCPWLRLARCESTPVSTVLRKSVRFFMKKKHSKLQSFIPGKWNWLISCLNDSETSIYPRSAPTSCPPLDLLSQTHQVLGWICFL